MDIGKIIKDRRLELGLTLEKVGNAVGVGKSTVRKWESGQIKDMRRDKIAALADVLRIPPATIILGSNAAKQADFSSLRKVPRLGAIPCGEPNQMDENFEAYDPVPDGLACDFTLKCEGDSMVNAQICDGDIVYIRQQPEVENGEIAAVRQNGATTLKRFYRQGDTVTLMPENPSYEPMVFSGDALNDLSIIGKAVGFTRIFK